MDRILLNPARVVRVEFSANSVRKNVCGRLYADTRKGTGIWRLIQ